ncbi:MAG: LysM peptidoglycan-binding protein [Paenibacillaceae bacterium]|nr:LysM peptidoglycan-binding protein [Paenibacillaceae bacterium]
MMRKNRLIIKQVVFAAVMVISLMFGAIIHVYAGGNPDPADQSFTTVPAATSVSSENTATDNHARASLAKATVDVCPGDTLWDIAAGNLPENESIRSYIHKIKKANGLKNSDIRAGQILFLP